MVAGWLVLACSLAACGDDGGSGGSGTGGGGTGGATTSTSSSAGGGSGVCTPGETEACAAYTGPQGTEGVGVCVASQRECLADGSAFGACGDEVLPSLENCATAGDDDCDGSAPTCTLTHQWSRGVAGSGFEDIYDVATDVEGNVVVAGFSNGPIDLGAGEVGEVGPETCFVAKYSPAGAHLWSHHYASEGWVVCNSVTTDPAGNVYFGGFFQGTFDFGGGQLSSIGLNVSDLFVVKLDPGGEHLWSQRYGSSSSNERASAMTLDAQDRPVLVGSFNQSADFGGQGLDSVGGTDVLVLALNADGGVRWARGFGGVGGELARAVDASSSGEIVVGGEFEQTVDFGGDAFVSQGGRDAFVLRLDSNGEHLASLGFGGQNEDWTSAIEVGPDGDIYLAANVMPGPTGVSAPFQFAGQTLNGLGNRDALLARLDPSLTPRWATVHGGPDGDTAVSLSLDSVGNLAFAGYFINASAFGGPTLTTPSSQNDLVLAKYDPSGAHLVSTHFGGLDGEGASSVAVDPSGNVVVVGWYFAPFSFGGADLPGEGNNEGEAFIAKFSP